MIDLHTHTNFSDGTWNSKEILEQAQTANIEVLSITDHDTIKVYKELENIDVKKYYTGKIIPGIEFSTVYDGVRFHLLAYDFDCKKIENWIYEKYENKKIDLNKEFECIVESCKKNNIKIGNITYDENKGWPVDAIFPEIKKYEENKKYFRDEDWNDINVFFNSFVTDKNFPVFVDFSIHYPKADEVVNQVRKAGGKTFIAHVFKYNLEDTISFLDNLKENNIIDGVEVYHSIFTEEQTKQLENYCKNNNLLISGGSDCHGAKKPDRKIGIGYGNLNIKKEILNNW